MPSAHSAWPAVRCPAQSIALQAGQLSRAGGACAHLTCRPRREMSCRFTPLTRSFLQARRGEAMRGEARSRSGWGGGGAQAVALPEGAWYGQGRMVRELKDGLRRGKVAKLLALLGLTSSSHPSQGPCSPGDGGFQACQPPHAVCGDEGRPPNNLTDEVGYLGPPRGKAVDGVHRGLARGASGGSK